MGKNKILAIIPARAGSKGLPNKNILDCGGKPLLAWTIEASRGCKYIDRTIVSTDSKNIADIAEKYGAWTPFIRPEYLSSDTASGNDVVAHAIENTDFDADFVILLQPTSPLRDKNHIIEAIDMFFLQKRSGNDTLVSVKEIDSKLLWAFGLNQNGYIYSHFGIDLSSPRRQSLPKCYLPNGAIYIAPVDGFHGFYGDETIPYIMSEQSSIDVDCQHDLERACELLQTRKIDS
ncbi:MAG: acylneuraminate cytidylyltransferase family protein [Gammaproteobacteria bacterium]|nr:acylneuraminate cytidylyltransferase family protein [Gammaproteobacteria bacterium]